MIVRCGACSVHAHALFSVAHAHLLFSACKFAFTHVNTHSCMHPLHAYSLFEVVQAQTALPEVGPNARVLQQRVVKCLQGARHIALPKGCHAPLRCKQASVGGVFEASQACCNSTLIPGNKKNAAAPKDNSV